MTAPKSPHSDPQLAKTCYPSGDKRTALSRCLCGAVEIEIDTTGPVLSAFCHCWACRGGHAAPVYQVLYCTTANIDCRTGEPKIGDHEVQVVKGFEHLKGYPGGIANAFHKNATDSETVGGIGRLYCEVCGTRMLNAFYRKIEGGGERYGVFPATFTEKMTAFIREWQPTCHLNCESAIVPVSAICDGLPKYVQAADGAKLVG